MTAAALTPARRAFDAGDFARVREFARDTGGADAGLAVQLAPDASAYLVLLSALALLCAMVSLYAL